MRCDLCQYWVSPDKDEWEPVRAKMGMCKHTRHADDMAGWSDDYSCRSILPEYADRTAAVSDASGYAATLYTAPEHFCAMFREATK